LQIGVHGVEERTQKAQNEASHAQKNAFVLFCGPLCAFCGSFPTTEWLLGTLRSVGLGVMTRVSSYLPFQLQPSACLP
jgi:hypothetical protein